MFRRAVCKVSSAAVHACPRAGFAAAARVPSIKFTHGARAAITAELAARSSMTPSHFATFSASSSAPAASSVSTAQVVGKTVTVGGVSTTTVYMPSTFLGNPFGGYEMSFDDAAMSLIEAGGAFDPPAPPKKGGKGGKPAKK
jgi:hypothetical protein